MLMLGSKDKVLPRSNLHQSLSLNSRSASQIRTQTRSSFPVSPSLAFKIEPAIPGTRSTGSRFGSTYASGSFRILNHASIARTISSNNTVIVDSNFG
ncbi:hypothetical protein HanHA300_Chr09g0320191 [Helianthus annuus]|nr:hypothetical protein HanHA300_Chr09g0320191 [Helianthus annuus]KAJ0707607.1 hypothetical protein HanLR1_Chr09g0320371 [Helianthus annuus]